VNIALWIAAGLLAAMFLMTGGMKAVTPREKLIGTMEGLRVLSPAQIKALGVVEILGAIGLILPRALNIAPVLTPLAAVGCMIVMIGATVVHYRMKDFKGIGVPVVLLILAIVVAAGRF
jgi:uncharacterized membrane protein YphA (DoxX/SURF4 family)